MDTDGLYFITLLKRDSKLPDYSIKCNNFFMLRKRAIIYTYMTVKKYDIHIFEVILLRRCE